MKRILVLLIIVLLLAGCTAPSPKPGQTVPSTDAMESIPTGSTQPSSVPTETQTPTQATSPTASIGGWTKEEGKTYYVNSDGSRHTGWLDLNGTRYYLNEQGVLQTGWLKLNGQEYYLKSDGSITRGKANIEGVNYYFTKSGARVILVNPWHFVPYDYTPNLVNIEGYVVDSSCRDALLQMLKDCRAAGHDARITSAYRTQSLQIELYNNKVNYYLNQGYDAATARTEAAKVIAVPGTSEHQLGLAVDLVDSSYWVLDEKQENTPAQKWLMEHCWEYGFILRYPGGKTEKTGIIYEPWHYRYVGKELAMEIKGTGLCLEEYFDTLK